MTEVPQIRDWEEACSFLLTRLPSYERRGIRDFRPGLENIKYLLEKLGNPHENMKGVLVAGTNGKGYVVHAISSLLMEYGFKVGIHTSPHIFDIRERFKIDGKLPIPDIPIKHLNQILHEIVLRGATFFESTVAIAFSIFKEYNVDYAVVEVGLGGRLDATNIYHSTLSVITSIGLDHMNVLGYNLEDIAKEKAGIIKEKQAVIVGPMRRNVMKVIETEAKHKNAHVYTLKDFPDLVDMSNEIKIKLKLFDAEGVNTALALASFNVLTGINPDFTHALNAIFRMRRRTAYYGRWHWLSNSPPVLLDAAHNIPAIKNLVECLPPSPRYHFVFALSNDRPKKKICSLFPENSVFYVTQYNGIRSLSAVVLKECLPHDKVAICTRDAWEAFQTAITNAKEKNEMVVVCGSFYLMAEIAKNILERNVSSLKSDLQYPEIIGYP